MKKNTEILISKYLSGNATSEEKTTFLKWLDEHENNRIEFDKYSAIWNNSKKLQIGSEVNVHESWLEFEALVKKPQIKTTSYRTRYLQIAAGLVLLISLSVVINFVVSDTTEETPKIISLIDPIIPSPLPDEYELFIDSLLSQSDSELVIEQPEKKRYKKIEPVNIVMITLTTGDSARAFLLPDNTVVFLNDHTTLIYPENFGKSNRKLQLNGEGYFEVNANTMQFVVSCFNTETRGTSGAFNIKAYDGDEVVEIIMASGSAEFSGVGKMRYKKLDLKAGERATYDKNDLISKSKNRKKDYKWWQKKNLRAKLKRFIENVKNVFSAGE